MARWASLVEARRSERPVLLVDAGDFSLPADTRHRDVIDRYVCEGMRLLGYDAVGVGELETRSGPDRLSALAKEHRLPLVCSNVIDRGAGRHPFPREIVRDLEGVTTASGSRGIVRVGIAAVALPAFVYRLEPAGADRYEVTDQRLAALESVERLRSRGCHLVVVLSHLGWKESLALAREVPGIDIVVNAHDAPRDTLVARIGSTVVVSPGRKEFDFVEASVVFGAGGAEIAVANRCPDALSSAGDQRLVDLQRRYAEEMRSLGGQRRGAR